MGLGGDAREALHEVERRAFGRQDGAAGTFDGHDDIAFGHGVAVVAQEADRQAAVDQVEDSLAHLGTAEDALLLGHHLGRAGGRGRNAGQGGVVAVAHILAQGHFDQFVKVLDSRHNCLYFCIIQYFPTPLRGLF